MTCHCDDVIEDFKGAVIQHGKYNDRIYLMKMTRFASFDIPMELLDLASSKGYSKIFAKVPASMESDFSSAGYTEEARIPGFFNGQEAAVFMVYYINPERSNEAEADKMSDVLKVSRNKSVIEDLPELNGKNIIRRCHKTDIPIMASLYSNVFPSYPFPVSDQQYLLKTMESHVAYFCLDTDEGLAALSSAEVDREYLNVEMTDFATLPEYRGKNLGQRLLIFMESEMRNEGIKTAYTIARSLSYGMNITFSRQRYQYAGRLKNNTNISGNIESMNVWHKRLD
ncbi:MAG: putative beta-lysine N-acetyltransferase [Dissulfurispiraceae bacterium]|jgi:putative beta-lysine N-acetyltransferase|nr:putative beta-lysine N-acetyltransferase [Dissulfurispiraceae bacterium]